MLPRRFHFFPGSLNETARPLFDQLLAGSAQQNKPGSSPTSSRDAPCKRQVARKSLDNAFMMLLGYLVSACSPTGQGEH